MADPEELGLSAARRLDGYAQSCRRESPEWRSMSRKERREEILALVTEAAEGRYVRKPEVRAGAVAELVVKKPDQWIYWVYKSREESQAGWFAWHVVHAMVRRLAKEDPEQLTKPPLSEWMARYVENPQPPARGPGRPRGASASLHRLAVLGVYALLESGLCDLTGKKKGGGRSCCDLVADRIGVGWRTVFDAWTAHREELAACVDAYIALHVAGQDSEPCPYETVLRAVAQSAHVYRVTVGTADEAWRKHGELAEYYAFVEIGSSRPILSGD